MADRASRWTLLCCLVVWSVCLPCVSRAIADTTLPETPPNIVVLFSDDAGYADFGFHGSMQFKTPNLDRLAAWGVRLSQFYVTAAVCGPSRAGMLTGRYQQRFGFEENNVPGYMNHWVATDEDMGLPLGLPTMADHLKDLGYQTALFGKWHLGEADRFHPTKRGFDVFVGFRGGARDYFPFEDDKSYPGRRLEHGFGVYKEHTGYLTDALADGACAFIKEHQDRPFFAFVSFNAVHTPMQADPKDLAMFPGLTGKRKVLAAMTLSLDRACGQIVDVLDELGLRENTLIIYTNDNGGPSDTNVSSNLPLSGTKANHLEGGIRVPAIISWEGRLPAGRVFEQPASTLDLLPTFVELGGGDAEQVDGLDGVDLMPFLGDEAVAMPDRVLYWKKENRGAIRSGDWKMLRFPDRPAELYNIAEDPSETNNLAASHPDRVRSFYKQLFAWELGLERPKWQLRREYEGKAAVRMDNYRQ